MTLYNSTRADLKVRGFSDVRTEAIIEKLVEVLKNNPYVENVHKDQLQVSVYLKELETNKKGSFSININKAIPNKTSPFVPIYHTVRADIVIAKGEETQAEHPLHTFFRAKRPFADNNLGEYFYSFGTYLDEGGEVNLKRVAEAISNEINKHINDWFAFVEREREQFKKSLK